ncbi:class I SAM-dependent methyltransferase [Parasedimentitalea huanghaiensis]|uniref:Methyltransferase n=1 Tax=Parasedimentitalea huanghaiensis TaxID=2682100 RepID=A0A6L6WD48_9RHOB|nr:class I SAM-dependent methyltransferase [Zongyanglinia huanghaiensis]MVO15181.1 methyltransferase [Zongyanglinia huanghaiensis]
MSIRLSLAIESGGFAVPESGKISVFHPREEHDLSVLPREQVLVVQPMRPDHDIFVARGYDCVAALEADTEIAAAIVFLPRAKALARHLIAQAVALSSGPVLIDGAKTDGIDSVLKAARKLTEPSSPISKAHGKVFWVEADGQVFADWHVDEFASVDGYATAPGVFSADGIDPASRLLAEALPTKLGRTLADLGAGWGYLSAQLLQRDDVIEKLHLIEADHTSLACAQRNVSDPRAEFHWADARQWKPPHLLDGVIMNPPFHTGRSAEPSLGQAFIATAARVLSPSGSLWLVANRHLPYETILGELFVQVSEIAGDNRFKVLHAFRPKRQRR